MDIRKLQRAIVDGLEDVKAQEIVVFNTEHLSPLFERVIIASGTSNRQTKALAASVRDAVRAAGFQVLRTEGQDNGEWIIVDCAAAVVHIMQPVIRSYYNLEDIWGEKPVAIQRKTGKTGLVKASEPMDEEDAKPAKAVKSSKVAKPAAVKQPAAKKVAAKKSPSKAPAAKKAASKKVVAKKAPTTITKVVVNAPVRPAAKKVAAKKVAVKKAPAKKSAVRSVAGKKVATKQVAAKKAVARKTSSRG